MVGPLELVVPSTLGPHGGDPREHGPFGIVSGLLPDPALGVTG